MQGKSILRTFERKRPPSVSQVLLAPSHIQKSKSDLDITAVEPPRKLRKTSSDCAKAKVQLHLDLGQHSFVSTTCTECGMGTEDEKVHARYHKKRNGCFIFKQWRAKAQVVKEFHAEDSGIIMAPLSALKRSTDKQPVIPARVGTTEELATQVLQTIDQQLGYDPSKQSKEEQCQAVGAVIVEPVTAAHRVIYENSASKSLCVEEDPTVHCCKESVRAELGVSRIWVHKDFRRRGIATKLLDTARARSCYGRIVPKDYFAFSQPTPDGKQLFAQYTGTQSFLVYD